MSDPDPLAELFLEEFGAYHEKLVTELGALETSPSPRAHADALSRAVQGLKSTALLVGHVALAELVTRLGSTLTQVTAGGAVDAAAVSVLRAALDLLREIALRSPGAPAEDVRARLLGLLDSVAAAPSPATPVPLAPTPSLVPARHDQGLMGVFRTEMESSAAALSAGLVELEGGGATASTLDKLMRAAHSLKGAARVVELKGVVELAHAMEDRFVAAQHSAKSIASSEVDLLLRGADQFSAIANLGVEQLHPTATRQAGELSALAKQIEALAAAAAGALATAPSVEAQPATRALAPSAESKATPPEGEARVVRVAAESINRLMGLAGESLVEARRVQGLSNGLAQLKQRHAALREALNDLEQLLREANTEALAGRLSEAKERAQECRSALAQRTADFEAYSRRADDLSDRLYREAQKTRMRPFADGLQALPRSVRDLSRQLGKSVRLEISGEKTQVDRDVLESLEAPLNHLVRNAIDHGVETGDQRRAAGKTEQARLSVEAHHRAGMLCIKVSDDGRGIDPSSVARRALERGLITEQMSASLSESELMDFLFLPGFSTAQALTDISGRGVGLDVVRSAVTAMGGNVAVSSELGRGTTFLLELPVTRSVLRAILVEIAGEPYAFPLLKIERVVRVPFDSAKTMEGNQYIVLDGRNIGLVRGEQLLRLELRETTGSELCVVVIGDSKQQVGVVVDDFLGEQDLVVRPLDARLGKVQDLAAAAILADGTPALIVDVDDLLRSVERLIDAGRLERVRANAGPVQERPQKRVLVVDDSITVREVERQLLVNRGYAVDVAIDGADGWNSVRSSQYDLIVTDLDMPRMSGIELVRAIKRDARLQSIPVVIVSYKDRPEDRLKGLDAGANYYLTKSSFHDDTFVNAVEELIGAPGA